MGDDIDAPHARSFSFPDAMPIEEVVGRIVDSGYLAGVQRGATWSVVSGFPIAVVAQRWDKPHPVQWQSAKLSKLQSKDGQVGLHFNYHQQLDPEVVLEVLRRLRLNAF